MGVGIGRALGRRLLPPFPFYQKWSVQAACRSKIQQWDERSEDPKLSKDDVRASRYWFVPWRKLELARGGLIQCSVVE